MRADHDRREVFKTLPHAPDVANRINRDLQSETFHARNEPVAARLVGIRQSKPTDASALQCPDLAEFPNTLHQPGQRNHRRHLCRLLTSSPVAPTSSA